jgi:Flp pilus assembly protein TadD
LALGAQGRPTEAEAELREAIRLRPNLAEAHNNLSNALADQGKYDEAGAELREAIRLRPNFAEAHRNLALVLTERQKHADAEVELREAIRLRPDYAEAHYDLGRVLNALGKYAEAVTELRKAIRLRPNYPEAYNSLGLALGAQGRPTEAEAELREAIRLRPNYADAHNNLGIVLRQQGRFAESLDTLRRSHELVAKLPRPPYPSAELVRQAEQLVALDAKLAKVLKAGAQPTGIAERIDLAKMCQQFKQLYAAAARFYADAFAAEPRLADDLRGQNRYNAACAAAQAGCGQGGDAAQLDEPERARLRRQALDWLRADLAAWGKRLEAQPDPARGAVRQTMAHWQQDTDFAGVRGPEPLARLPEAERRGWQQLWADVEALRQRATERK